MGGLFLLPHVSSEETETLHTAVGACEPAWHGRPMGLQIVHEESVHGHALKMKGRR